MEEYIIENLIDAEIGKKLKEYLTEKRYDHTIGVCKTALRLSGIYGGDREKLLMASLLHDVARDLSIEEMREIIKTGGRYEHISPIVVNNPLLLHGYAGRVIAENIFGVKDLEVLNAIEIHTTGSINMSLVDKIVFVSDYIEPGRTFRGVKRARELADRDLDRAVLYIIKETLKRLIMKGEYILPCSFELYNHWVITERMMGENGR
ncbi:MAG: hypothetical protein DRP54_08295 [Spirochaetes bacterium]|nr:MAG: hypothetical protein DRP54_08295 [Spirochaetota bacterium]